MSPWSLMANLYVPALSVLTFFPVELLRLIVKPGPTLPFSFTGVMAVKAIAAPADPRATTAATTAMHTRTGILLRCLTFCRGKIRDGVAWWIDGSRPDRRRTVALDGVPRGVEARRRLRLLRKRRGCLPDRPARAARGPRSLCGGARPRRRAAGLAGPRARHGLLAHA